MKDSRDDNIITSAQLIATNDNQTFLAELPNGKAITVHLAKNLRQQYDALASLVPCQVTLKMTPFDFDKGCIIKY